jgi:hypothetical protein
MAVREHGIVILTKFCKDVWRADIRNSLFHPEAYLSDRLIKEILDKFSITADLQLDFDALATAKKTECSKMKGNSSCQSYRH